MSGTIAVIQGDMSRWAEFDRWLVELQRPSDTRWIWARGLNIAQARNQTVESMSGDWIWFLDDDMSSYDRDLLPKLLARDVDIVQPLSLNRKTLQYNAFTSYDGTGFVAWEGGQNEGLLPVVACGTGGTLIRKNVLDSFEKPIFRVGTFAQDVVSEDLHFTHSATRKGFKCYVDLDNRMNHFTGVSLEIELKDDVLTKLVRLPFHKLFAGGI